MKGGERSSKRCGSVREVRLICGSLSFFLWWEGADEKTNLIASQIVHKSVRGDGEEGAE